MRFYKKKRKRRNNHTQKLQISYKKSNYAFYFVFQEKNTNMRSHSRKYLYQKKRQSRILFVTNAVTTSQMLQQNGGEAVKHLNPPPPKG